MIATRDLVDLDAQGGIEAFVSRRPSWKLNVQGVILDAPTSRPSS